MVRGVKKRSFCGHIDIIFIENSSKNYLNGSNYKLLLIKVVCLIVKGISVKDFKTVNLSFALQNNKKNIVVNELYLLYKA